MKKLKTIITKLHLSWQRRIQILSLFIMNAYFLPPFLRSICIPAFNCHSCPAATFACPIGIIQNFSMLKLVPLSAIAIVGITSAAVGKMACGWICPFGFIQDMLYKIKTVKIRVWEKLSYIKYGILILFAIMIPFFIPNSPLMICRLCPVGTLEAGIPWRIIGGVSSQLTSQFMIRLVILFSIIFLVIVSSRFFCHVLCPLGAIFSLFNKISFFRLKVDKTKCTNCNLCKKVCPFGVKVADTENYKDCIRCLECTICKHVKLSIK